MKNNRLESLFDIKKKDSKYRTSAEIFEATQKDVGGVKLYTGEISTPRSIPVADVEGVYEAVRESCYFHYDAFYAGQGIAYEYYEPAYRFGAEIAASPQYKNMLWVDVRDKIEARWEADNPDTWDELHVPLLHGWNLTKQRKIRKPALEPA